ncbi:hypothetical protein FGADI_9092 [Fusarium gaditjirri]|uniref:NACHT domain-containing protein n=1 Tax=Fusarium gaditjirri TaxID=282569 RepID=A0A8H4WTC2_9HYPO|nr:hypothetical protein FGADI_9092 [Fusarium gaditjirri]
MATGLEALGAASAVIQLISFAGSLISLSLKIYDGNVATSVNELEEYLTKMMEAARRVQSRTSPQVPQVPSGTQGTQGTQVGDKLFEVSQECIDTASKLKKEAQKLTKQYKMEKGKVFKAIYSALRAESHKTKINQLNESLKKCKELMETELLLNICDQDTAIAQKQSQGFRSLEMDIQNLILKIAEGCTKVEQLVSIEGQATRDAINTHVTSEFKALGIRNITDNQRERLLKSLKPEEIRERYNAVLPSSDACFERVFASYERVCRNDPRYKAWRPYGQDFDDGSDNESWFESENEVSEEDLDESDWTDESGEIDEVDEIDHLWESFSTWLQSDDKLFWIRGKPGSGKSTLIKFVINNDNTKRLLGSWSPGTKLLSHFFWKIGSEPQNSIKGLLCSLLYDLLSEDNDAMDRVLREFPFSQSKDFYKEWSRQEAEMVLLSLLRYGAHPICLLIDGLDEISNKDGFSALLDTIQKFTSYQKVKVCVSSRPETELVIRLESIGAQSLRLENLTRPEMAVYVNQEFHQLPQSRRAGLPLEKFKSILLAKAQGVFLWLALATKSVTSGILNGDDQETLIRRLEQLPEELESLYQTMWERLNGSNRVYRETAARYFRFVLADGWTTGLGQKNGEGFAVIVDPNLVQLSLAVKIEDGLIFPPKVNGTKIPELEALCTATESDIQTRCAGMLQVGRQSSLHEGVLPNAMYMLTRPVQFIHRTARDFLIDTEAGQSILNYKSIETTSVDTELKLLKCRLNLANMYYRELEVVVGCQEAFEDCHRLNYMGANPGVILAILGTIKDLYESGALGFLAMKWESHPSFPCVAAYLLASFDDFIISSFMPTPSPELATNSLHELTLLSTRLRVFEAPVRRIRRMIELGGEAHVAKKSDLSFELPGYEKPVTQITTAFESLLYRTLESPTSTTLLDVIEVMAQTCPDLHRRVILFRGQYNNLLSYHQLNKLQSWVALEVDLQCLISRLLAVVDSRNLPIGSSNIRELVSSFSRPHIRIRHIGCYRKNGQLYCYRVLDQEPFLAIIHSFNAGKYFPENLGSFRDAMCRLTDGHFDSVARVPLESFERVTFEEEIDMLVQEDVGLYRGENSNVARS